jgi:hypothetical protein
MVSGFQSPVPGLPLAVSRLPSAIYRGDAEERGVNKETDKFISIASLDKRTGRPVLYSPRLRVSAVDGKRESAIHNLKFAIRKERTGDWRPETVD